MPQQCFLQRVCIHSIQESTLKDLIGFRGQFGGKLFRNIGHWLSSVSRLRIIFVV